jgi:hypothetical protein
MRWRALLVAMTAVLAIGAFPAQGAPPPPKYVAPACTLAVPAANGSSRCGWQGISLQSPSGDSNVAGPDTTVACHPDTTAECEDTKVTVPSGVSPSTLYVKVSWQHPVWSAFLYVIDPNGKLHGQGGLGCDASSYEKGCGNQTTLPFDELAVADPIPGVWTIRVAAVSMHDEPYSGLVALTNQSPLAYARASLAQMMSTLTRNEPVNVVFAGWQPTADELAQLQASLTSEFVPSVSEKVFCDGADSTDLPGSGLIQHETNHCTATADPADPNYSATGTVPYFEPLRYLMQYHFLSADDSWTKDLFSVMKSATTQDHKISDGRVPTTAQTAPFKTAFLNEYNATNGVNRGSKLVTDTSTVDEIDGVSVEQWIQDHRFDAKYAASFTDLVTGSTQSPAFINPDPKAIRDPFWNHNGTAAPNLDHSPEGDNTGVTFFLLDTFSPSYADDYFRPNKYHYWWTADHVKDPDFNEAAYTDNGRGWGGRYRFHILDLGAAPSTYERANWLSASLAPDGGSQAFDPPIWDYRNSPLWNGSLPPNPLQAGGNTLGSVMGWEITQGLVFKYVGGYLYRPIPNDVYVLATSSITDHYSLPSEGDLYSVDMTKIAQLDVALTALSSAAPYASFTQGPDQTKVLGCAPNRAAIVGNPTQAGVLTPGLVNLVPDPKCGASPDDQPDPFQQAIENGKANGSGGLVTVNDLSAPDFAVNQDYIRDYIDHHRADYAPLYDGAFTVPVVNIMFEHAYTVALPFVVGGIAENVNGGEGWGQIDNVNDQYVMAGAIDCSKSLPVAPGCNGVPDVFRHDVGLTYTMEHESAHFLGLPHPHDGAVSVGVTNGQWHYYYEMLKWLYDISASPTTYAGTYGTYEAIDQDRLMAGHAAEYFRQAQDWVSDAYFMDGVDGRSTPSAHTNARRSMARSDENVASRLFQAGDYLHAQYSMRNAALHAKGVHTAPVAAHRMSLDEAANDTNAIFTIRPQQPFGPLLPVNNVPPAWFASLPAAAPTASSNASTTSVHQASTAGLRSLNYCHIRYS